ncbi:MAG: MYG1 family protein [Verrucomicrobiales bacterium]
MSEITEIITHPGGAHKDDFLACCLLAYQHRAPISRREPEQADLDDPHTAVVDVGGIHDPDQQNFDHHQFPRDHPPVCALTLVLQSLDAYDEACLLCDWLPTTEYLDTRGPNDTARWLGIERDVLSKLNSPIDLALLSRFEKSAKLIPGEPLWEIMSFIGEDLLGYLRIMSLRLEFLAERVELWEIDAPHGSFEALYLPRGEQSDGDSSMGLGRYLQKIGKEDHVRALIYPDRRGDGYGLSRFNDHPSLDLSRLEDEADVHFAHARGFIAKTSATEEQRLRQLLASAQIPQA